MATRLRRVRGQREVEYLNIIVKTVFFKKELLLFIIIFTLFLRR